MNKLNNIKRGLFALIMCLSLSLCGCGNTEQTEGTGTSSAESQQSADVSEEVIIDYGDAESFEAALNEGKNLEGKVVMEGKSKELNEAEVNDAYFGIGDFAH